MSRPSPFQRYGSRREDIETVPLAGADEIEPWYQERDLTDERLPTYGEAIADQTNSASRIEIAASDEPQPPRDQMTLASTRPTRPRLTTDFSKKSLNNFSPCLLGPVIALILGTIFCGMNYLNDFADPTPPTASPESASTSKGTFISWVIAWGLIAYPFLFAFLLLMTPKIFTLPKIVDASQETAQSWRKRHPKGSRYCCGIYCGLTVLYFGIVAVVLWGMIFLANTKLNRTYELFLAEPWAGNYIVMEKTFDSSTVSLFSKSGVKLGDVVFTEMPNGWTMDVNSTAEAIERIIYTNSTNLAPIIFNATCRTVSTNSSGAPCLSGSLDPPLPYNPGMGHHPVPEYYDAINITISALNNSSSVNISSHSPVLWTTDSAYQGIGGKYPPLGSWYLNTIEVLEVSWSPNGTRACQGLVMNLSQSNELFAWSIVGLIWEWWGTWGENGGCSW